MERLGTWGVEGGVGLNSFALTFNTDLVLSFSAPFEEKETKIQV